MLKETTFVIAVILAASSDALEASDIQLKHEVRKLAEGKFKFIHDYLYKHGAKVDVIPQEVKEHRNLGKGANNISYIVYDEWLDYVQEASSCGYPQFLNGAYRKPNDRAAIVLGHSTPSSSNCHNNIDGTSSLFTGCIRPHLSSHGTGTHSFYEIDTYDKPDCKGDVVSSPLLQVPDSCFNHADDVHPVYTTLSCEYKYPFKDMPGFLYSEFDTAQECRDNHNPSKFIHFDLHNCFGNEGPGFYGHKCENNVAKYTLYGNRGCHRQDLLASKVHERWYPNNDMDCNEPVDDKGITHFHTSLKCSNNHLFRDDTA